MRNLKVTMAYNGTAYHGYQRQNNANSIQQTVEEVLSKLLCEDITINGCSRTDTGVHARAFVFNVKNELPHSLRGLYKRRQRTFTAGYSLSFLRRYARQLSRKV